MIMIQGGLCPVNMRVAVAVSVSVWQGLHDVVVAVP